MGLKTPGFKILKKAKADRGRGGEHKPILLRREGRESENFGVGLHGWRQLEGGGSKKEEGTRGSWRGSVKEGIAQKDTVVKCARDSARVAE